MGDHEEKNEMSNNIRQKISELRRIDCWVEDDRISEILACGEEAVPYFEDMLSEIIQESRAIDLRKKHPNTEWFTAIHCLCFLAHLKSEKSMDLVLSFLSQKQDTLDFWLHDILTEDLWEIFYLLGQNKHEKLGTFILDQKGNLFSRLAACTALVQIALHHESAKNQIVQIFREVLHLAGEDADFIGLVVGELLDLCDDRLLEDMLAALQNNHVIPAIMTPSDVILCMQKKRVRKLIPLTIFERYYYFRQLAYFAKTTPGKSVKEANLRELQKLLK